LHDVLVVGGGPAGLAAGAAAAEMGARVKVLEEDREVGEPDHCAGLVSSRGVRSLVGGRGAVINEIRGARIFSPTGRCYTVRAEGVKAYVVDRPRFDREMRRMAEGAGAEVETGVRYAKGMECKVLVVAEGTRAMVARRLGFEVPRSIPAAQLDFDADAPEPDMVEFHASRLASGFFAWVVPRRGRVRVGLASYKGVPLQLLRRLVLKDEGIRRAVGGARCSEPIFGKIVVGGPVRRAVRGNAVVVGDAGGFVKPTTGGGVAIGGAVARMAGRAAAEAALLGRPLTAFEDRWRKAFEKEFNTMGLAARIFRNMSGFEMESALGEIGRIDLLNTVAGYDFDLQRAAVNRAIRSRLGIYAVLPLVRSIFER